MEAFFPMGFEYADKKTAQEVPLLFQGPALILFYTEIRLGRYQPQDLFMGLGPRFTKPQHPWNPVPDQVPKDREGHMNEDSTTLSFPRYSPHPLYLLPSYLRGSAQALLTYPPVESAEPPPGSKDHCQR